MPSATFLHRMVSYYNDVADGCLGTWQPHAELLDGTTMPVWPAPQSSAFGNNHSSTNIAEYQILLFQIQMNLKFILESPNPNRSFVYDNWDKN